MNNANMIKISVFNMALDAFNAYMSDQGGYVFDTPTREFSRMEDGCVYLANAVNTFGRYEIDTETYIPDDSEDE
ncbi:hypothetical protein [Alistipes timonensis]